MFDFVVCGSGTHDDSFTALLVLMKKHRYFNFKDKNLPSCSYITSKIMVIELFYFR